MSCCDTQIVVPPNIVNLTYWGLIFCFAACIRIILCITKAIEIKMGGLDNGYERFWTYIFPCETIWFEVVNDK